MANYLHTVSWKLKEENKAQNKQLIKDKLYVLKDIIPGIISLEVYTDTDGTGNCDACLHSVFESVEALKAYDTHPEHEKVREFIRGIIQPGSRVAVDILMDN